MGEADFVLGILRPKRIFLTGALPCLHLKCFGVNAHLLRHLNAAAVNRLGCQAKPILVMIQDQLRCHREAKYKRLFLMRIICIITLSKVLASKRGFLRPSRINVDPQSFQKN